MTSRNEMLRTSVLYGQGASNLCCFDTEARTLKLGGREYHTVIATAQERGWLSAAGQVSKIFPVKTSSRMVELTNSGDNKTYSISGLSPQVDVASGLVTIFFFNATGVLRAVNTDPYAAIPATDSYIKAVTSQDPIPVLDPLATATNAVTATSISATLDAAYATKVYAIYRTVEVEYASSHVATGYVVINAPASCASLRLAITAAEAESGLANTLHCKAGEWRTISFYAKALKGTPNVKIRCYDASGNVLTLVRSKLYEGNIALGSGGILCTLDATLNRFSAAFMVPTGGRYVDIAVDSPTAAAGGDNVCFITSYMAAQTDVDIPYYPSAVTYALQRPLEVADGNSGEVLSTDGRGNVRWVAQTGGGGGSSEITSINTLTAAAQTIAGGAAVATDIDGIAVSSNTDTHTLSVAKVETLTTATKHGSLLKSDYDSFVAVVAQVNPPTGNSISPTGIEPLTDNAYDLGTADKRWRKIYAVDIDFTGALTKNGVTFAPEESAQIYSMFWS
jgi:hypothetical protein